jgi:hypothetical protein
MQNMPGNDHVQLHVNFSKNVQTLPKKSHAYLQCVHNNCAKFEECQSKGVSGIPHSKSWMHFVQPGQKINKRPRGHIAHLSHIG